MSGKEEKERKKEQASVQSTQKLIQILAWLKFMDSY